MPDETNPGEPPETVVVPFRWEKWKLEALDRWVKDLRERGWDVSRSSLCAQALDEYMVGRLSGHKRTSGEAMVSWVQDPETTEGGPEGPPSARPGEAAP